MLDHILDKSPACRKKLRRIPTKVYDLADPEHQMECNKIIYLTFSFVTKAGRLNVRGAAAHVTDADLHEVLIGREILRILGIDPEDSLKELIRTKGGEQDHEVTVVASDSTITTDITNHSAKRTVVEENSLCETLGEEGEDPTPISLQAKHSMISAIDNMVTEAAAEGLAQEYTDRLRRILDKNKSIWRLSVGLDEPAMVTPMDVRLEPNAEPVRCKARRYPPLHSEFMHEHVQMLEDAGLVYRNPNSAWASPALVVKKPGGGGGYRLCVDLRAVNSKTVASAWPMPMFETLADHLKGSACYATLDLWKGYWQFPLAEDKQEIFSFMTHEGVFTPTRIIQGSKNGTNFFQSGLSECLRDLLYKGVLLWVDDVLVYGANETHLLDHLEQIFETFAARNIKCSAAKCHLFLKQAKWCGRIISEKGITPDPDKITALTEMSTPTTAAELQQFLCAMAWLKSALPEFVRVTAPLQALLDQALRTTTSRSKREAKNIKLATRGWSTEHDDAFAECKTLLQNAVTLAHPDPQQEFCLFTDASNHSWGAILTQIPEEDLHLDVQDQRHTPLQFLGGKFTGSKANWSIVEKEAFALVESCLRLDNYLLRPKPCRIFTDHRNLLYILDPNWRPTSTKKYTDAKLERWALKLQAFPFTIEHIAGEANVWADLISRWASSTVAEEVRPNTVSTRAVNDAKIFVERAATTETSLESGRSLVVSANLESSTRSLEKDLTCPAGRASGVTTTAGGSDEHSAKSDSTVFVAARLRSAQCFTGVRPLDHEEFEWPDLEEIKGLQQQYLQASDVKNYSVDEEGVIRLTGRVWIPPQATQLKTRLIVIAHCGWAGHRGIYATTTAIANRFKWKGLTKDVKLRLEKCLHCVTTRGGKVIPRPLGSTLVAIEPNQILHMDFLHLASLGDDVTQSENYIGEFTELLVLKDGLSHFCELVPCISADSTSVVQALMGWFARYGTVTTWVSDQGSHFKNQVLKELKQRLNTTQHFTPAYCPWVNGTVERLNRDILAIFRALLSERRQLPREWPQLCPLVQSSINNTASTMLNNLAPITVFLGRPASNPLDAVFSIRSGGIVDATKRSDAVNIGELTNKLRTSMQVMHKEVAAHQEKMRSAHKEKYTKGTLPNFDTGDYVLVAKHVMGLKQSKLTATWYGPMQIVGSKSPWLYEVKNLLTDEVQQAHCSHLRFYHDPSLLVTEELKLQLAHDGAGYEVERFKEHRSRAGRWELLVIWQGFQEAQSTWEPLLQLYQDVPALVRAYLSSFKEGNSVAKTRRDRDNMVKMLKKKYPSFALHQKR